MATRTYISVITLNVNGLNAPTKRHRLAEWIQKQDPYMYAVFERPTSLLGTHTNWKWEDGRKYSMQTESKESWSSNTHIIKIDLKIKAIIRDKEGH